MNYVISQILINDDKGSRRDGNVKILRLDSAHWWLQNKLNFVKIEAQEPDLA